MEYIKTYVTFLKGFLQTSVKIRVLFDCSNGSTGLIIKELFQNHENIEIVLVNDMMDGDFPGHGPNPLDQGVGDFMKAAVTQNKVDMGVVFDGDGDRVFFFDDLGGPLDSYEVFGYIKKYFKTPYVVDVRALVEFTMPQEEVIETKVGRYFVVKAMKEKNAELGVEYSGHFYFKDFFYTDSGILAAIHMLNYLSELKQDGKSLSDVKQKNHFVRLSETNFAVVSVDDAVSKLSKHFSTQGKTETMDGISVYTKDFALNARGAATEPVIRFSLVARDTETLQRVLGEAKEVLGIDA